jgi:K+-transporting ATPase ATPase C chain
MIQQIKPALILFLLLAFLTGVVYPLGVTGIAQTVFPTQANGSLIDVNGSLAGSILIGQDFTSPKYFWGRPSMTTGSPYNAFDSTTLTGSSGSNLGPLSQSLFDAIQKRSQLLRSADPGNTLLIPIDLVTASASGLDPHISLEAADYQAVRVARSRSMSEADVLALITKYSEDRQFGFLGEPRVNILLLNLALDKIK